MQKKIHPVYGSTIIRCACGNVIETRSTKKEITVDVCSVCHPFFTGQQKLVDTAGRIEKFKKKFGGRIVTRGKAKAVKVRKKNKVEKNKSEQKTAL